MKQKASLTLRVPARAVAALRDVAPQPNDNVADWLQEVARRPWVGGPPSVNPTVVVKPPARAREQPKLWHQVQSVRELTGLVALTIGWLQYYFLDAMVQINSLPKVIVFVPLGVA